MNEWINEGWNDGVSGGGGDGDNNDGGNNTQQQHEAQEASKQVNEWGTQNMKNQNQYTQIVRQRQTAPSVSEREIAGHERKNLKRKCCELQRASVGLVVHVCHKRIVDDATIEQQRT